MADSMIERVARAIALCQTQLSEEHWQYCLPEARAALEAMRQPKMRQLAAAQTAWLADPERKSSTVYTAMIDAALNERVPAWP